MKKVINWGLVIIGAVLVGACAAPVDEQAANVPAFPQDRDGAAHFLASSARERWMLMVQDDGMGNAVYANKERIVLQPDGVSTVWLRMVFPVAIPLSAQSSESVTGTLIYSEVRCKDSTYRTPAFYALDASGHILDITSNDQAPFVAMDAGAAALGLYRMACESL